MMLRYLRYLRYPGVKVFLPPYYSFGEGRARGVFKGYLSWLLESYISSPDRHKLGLKSGLSSMLRFANFASVQSMSSPPRSVYVDILLVDPYH